MCSAEVDHSGVCGWRGCFTSRWSLRSRAAPQPTTGYCVFQLFSSATPASSSSTTTLLRTDTQACVDHSCGPEAEALTMDYCNDCERWFRNIRAHYTRSSKHVYCERCDRHFASVGARQMHWDNSCAHNLCDECGFDGEDWDELEDHFRAEGCYPYTCHGCNTWFPDYPSYNKHTEAFVACPTCDKHCVNQNNLDQHMISHAVAKIECWGCYRKFINLSHMVLHLESGTCPSGCSLHDINYTLMSQCNNLHRFVSSDYGQDFRRGIDIQQVYGRAFPFECKGCGDIFRLLSGLCQHMENSNTCDQHISDVSFQSLQHRFERKFL